MISILSNSVQLSKEDRMYKDAIDTASESADCEIAEDLLRFFVRYAHHTLTYSHALYSHTFIFLSLAHVL
jgi:hypothetical protein